MTSCKKRRQGELPVQVKFWPDDKEIAPPIGGSYLAVQTKDSRLFIYQYISASPDYWTVLGLFLIFFKVRNFG